MRIQYTETYLLTPKGQVEYDWEVTDYTLDPEDDVIDMKSLFEAFGEPYQAERTEYIYTARLTW